MSQLGGTLSDEAELEELCDVTLKQKFKSFKPIHLCIHLAVTDVFMHCTRFKLPFKLFFYVLGRHEAGPPSHLPLGFVLHILLAHLLPCTVQADDVLMLAGTERNLCIFVCQIDVFQRLRRDRGRSLAATLSRKTQQIKGTYHFILNWDRFISVGWSLFVFFIEKIFCVDKRKVSTQ